ncbi:MAG: hypothetical protein COB08_003215 [Rhodobacteraceae bacterium]|nr:hypothetical protein [Paracoccaceae bacterium]
MTPEFLLRQSIPVFVNSFSQLVYLRDTIDWFRHNGFNNITVMDNASTSGHLLDYFESDDFKSKARFHQIGKNVGPRTSCQLAQSFLGPDSSFIFTDPDLWLPDDPDPDMLLQMFKLGKKYNCPKVGLALDISEPELFRNLTIKSGVGIILWEERYWKKNKEVQPNVYKAQIDTTFFLHVPDSGSEKPMSAYGWSQHTVPSLRLAGSGFLAKHRPWYIDDGLSDEERNLYHSTATGVASWSRNLSKDLDSR